MLARLTRRGAERPRVARVLVATDRSPTATRAVQWAAEMAERYEAELVVLQIASGDLNGVETELSEYAEAIHPGARAVVRSGDDFADAIVDAARAEDADVLVVGSVGMRGRKEFLLGNVPNRVSHNAHCTVVIVDTSAPVSVEPEVEGTLLGRATRIGVVMARHGLRDRGGSTRDRARALRESLEELGPTFAKLGQILSTRPDLIPPEFVEELAALQDQVAPLSEAEVVAVMEEELGVPWEDVFESVDPSPLAAGTIGQVHRARLENGDAVVVKVQRPTAREEILRDLGLLSLFAEKTKNRAVFRQIVDVPAVIDHLSDSLRRELDFHQEAANIERMREVLAPFSRLGVPLVYERYTSTRLLVLEEIQGVPITQAPPGEARREAARQLVESYFRQILSEGFFHADPHPGNLLWCDERVYFLDLGMVGEVAPETRELVLLLLMAFWQEDAAFLTEVVLTLAGDSDRPDVDLAGLRADLGALLGTYRHASLQELELGPILQSITETATQHGVRLPASLALTGKALAQMQSAATVLDPTLDPFAAVGGFVLRDLLTRLAGSADPKRLFYEGQKLRVRATRLVEAFERVTGARPGQKLQVQFRGTELEEVISGASRRLSLGLTGAAAILGSAVTAAQGVDPWVPVVFGGAGAVLTGMLLVDLLRGRR